MSFRWSKSIFLPIVARVAVAPVSSEQSFLDCIQTLDPHNKQTYPFWQKLETQIADSNQSIRIDEIKALGEWVWFENFGALRSTGISEKSSTSITDYFCNLTSSLLNPHGARIKPKLPPGIDSDGNWNDSRSARLFWIWLTKYIPGRTLVAGVESSGEFHFLSEVVEEMLTSRGFAETHMHLGASMTFPYIWTGIFRQLLAERLDVHRFAWHNAELNGGRDIMIWLMIAAISRQVMAQFLFRSQHSNFSSFLSEHVGILAGDLAPWLNDTSLKDSNSRMPSIAFGSCENTYSRLGNSPSALFLLHRCMGALLAPNRCEFREQRHLLQLQTFFREICPLPQKNVVDLETFLANDPIAPLIDSELMLNTHAEDRWFRASIRYLTKSHDRSKSFDKLYERLFWQIQRIKNITYRHLTQPKNNTGLRSFLEFYPRISPFRKSAFSHSTLLRTAAETCGYRIGLRSLEVRIGPPDDQADPLTHLEPKLKFLDEIRSLASTALQVDSERKAQKGLNQIKRFESTGHHGNRRQANSASRTLPVELDFEFGVVVHFVKERTDSFQSLLERIQHQQRHQKKSGRVRGLFYEFSEYSKKIHAQTDRIVWILDHYPLTLQWLRGIDICNDELSIPTWVFVDIFKRIREASCRASELLKRKFGVDIPIIRLTTHAGEDFDHLQTGLRRIDEVIEFLEIGEGGRIGHGLALGVRPSQWADNSGPIAMRKITRLFDLSWEHTNRGHFKSSLSGNRQPIIEAELNSLIEDLFGHWNDQPFLNLKPLRGLHVPSKLPPPTIDEIRRLRQNAADPEMLRAIGFPNWDPVTILHKRPYLLEDRAFCHLIGYLADPQLALKAASTTIVNPKNQGQVLKELQSMVRKKVSELGVTIEVNPSSNELIGTFGLLEEHPVWRLDNPKEKGVHPVSLCIGSDDPLVFATNLPQEYQRLLDSLSKLGFNNRVSLRWLNEIRESGLSNRFTLNKILPLGIDELVMPFTMTPP